jgi:hypothetical protein
MKRFESRWGTTRALPGMILVMAALASPNRAAAHCGEHGDSCGPSEWQEVSGGGCESGADPYVYGTWWQPYRIYATWCDRPVMCVPATCSADTPCSGIGRTCVNGACSCPPRPDGRVRILQPRIATTPSSCLRARLALLAVGHRGARPCAVPRAAGPGAITAPTSAPWPISSGAAAGDGLISESQHDALMEAGAESTCGRRYRSGRAAALGSTA